MWEFFKRIFRIFRAEANSAVDKLENPIKLTKQGIRDLKTDLDKALKSLAEVKAIAIRSRRDAEQQKQLAGDYEKKAMALLRKASSGSMDMGEADRLASEALLRKEETMRLAKVSSANQQKYDGMVSKMEVNVKRLKSEIAKWENELKTLEARAKVSTATKKLNKQMANIDSSGTIEMLKRMREKVEEEEALAESYGELADVEKSIDQEIDKALADAGAVEATDALKALKEKMGMKAEESPIEMEIKEPIKLEVKEEGDADADKA